VSARRNVTRIHVEFGDCDPAGIVFYPNYFRWMDASAWHYFAAIGVARWDQVDDAPGLIGIPLVDAGARFLRPASYGDTLDVDTTVTEWRERSFVLSHVVRRGDETLVEGREVRVFACADPLEPRRLRAIAPPPSVRQRIDGQG
jgi:4-hydroxybenzoyl-CoA thioesterase